MGRVYIGFLKIFDSMGCASFPISDHPYLKLNLALISFISLYLLYSLIEFPRLHTGKSGECFHLQNLHLSLGLAYNSFA